MPDCRTRCGWPAACPRSTAPTASSAAFNNLAEREELTARYQALCQHYGVRPTRNNTDVSHENGAIEARQGSLKKALDQGLLLRGSRAFDDLAAYEQFIAETVRRLNTRCARAWEAERACLRPLPARRTPKTQFTVGADSLIPFAIRKCN